MEIIVVADQQDRIAVKGAKIVKVPPKLGSDESRNTGCRQAQRGWLLLIDDNLVPSPGLACFINELLPRLNRDFVGWPLV